MNNVFLTEELKNKVNTAEIVSFDIFDTLLVRPYIRPVDLFYHLEQIHNVKGFADIRINAEITARKKSSKAEINIYDIYKYIPKKYLYLMEKEMDFEYSVARINPIIEPIYNYVKECSKKIILISSMYLPKEFLAKVLQKIGIDTYEKLIVSNEIQANKVDGSIYREAIKIYNISEDKFLHIGDDENKDYKPAIKEGMNAYLLPKLIEYYSTIDERCDYFISFAPKSLDTSILISMIAYNFVKNECESTNLAEKDYFQSIGYQLGGFLAYQYISWISHKASQDEIKDILFVARDGYTLKKVMELINPDINSKYVYAPRKLSLGLSLDFDNNNLDQVHSVANFYRKELGIEPSPNDYNFPVLKNELEFIENNIARINKIRDKYKEEYINYLNTINFNTRKFAVVDTATLWATSSRLFSYIYPNSYISSYFWRLNSPFNEGNLKNHYFDDKNESNSLVRPYDIIEFLFTSPEPSISMVKNNKPIYNVPTEKEQRRNSIYNYISEGILNCVSEIKQLFCSEQILFSKETVFKWVNVYMNNPSDNDIYFFQDIYHAGDVQHEKYRILFPSWYKNMELPITRQNNKKDEVQPAFLENNIPIIMASSNSMAIMMGIAISSIKQHADSSKNYDICILNLDVDEEHKQRIYSLKSKNFSIRFIDMKKYIKKYNFLMYTRQRMSVSTYFRFFIPELFSKYSKCIWLDADIIVRNDISKLFSIDIRDYYVAAALELGVARLLYTNDKKEGNWRTYIREQLQLTDATKYFSAGIMVWNLEKLKRKNFSKICFEKLETISKPYTYDQDVLNILFQNNIYDLDIRWNVPWNLKIKYPNYEYELPNDIVEKYKNAIQNPSIIHYCGSHKPWYVLNNPLSDIFWSYARQTVFYEELISYKYLPKSESSRIVNSINNRFSVNEAHIRTILFMNNMFSLKCKKVFYRIKKLFALGNRKKKYRIKYNVVKGVLNDTQKSKKEFLKQI